MHRFVLNKVTYTHYFNCMQGHRAYSSTQSPYLAIKAPAFDAGLVGVHLTSAGLLHENSFSLTSCFIFVIPPLMSTCTCSGYSKTAETVQCFSSVVK